MTELIEFLRACLDDDERDARMAASASAGARWEPWNDGVVRGSGHWLAESHPMAVPHIVR